MCVSPLVHHHLFGQTSHHILVVVLDLILGIINVHIVGSDGESLLRGHYLNAMVAEQQAIEVAESEEKLR